MTLWLEDGPEGTGNGLLKEAPFRRP
jgi:hypothetical protein